MFTNVNRPSAVDVLRPFVVGDIFTADTTSTLAKVADVAVGNVLLSGGVGAVPAWGKVTLSSHVSGVLPAINGGTGVANTGTITNASNTTITGGGTVALGGFTLTVPATGTAALLGETQTFTGVKTFDAGAVATTVRVTGTATGANWSGRVVAGGPSAVFLMGQYNDQAWLGAHNPELTAWESFYLNPDGGATLFLGKYSGSSIAQINNADGIVTLGITASLALAKTTGTTLTVSSTDAASVSLAGGILLDGATAKTIKYTNGTANAAVAVTFGAVGPTGSTAGNQLGWLRVNIGGTDRYIPYW